MMGVDMRTLKTFIVLGAFVVVAGASSVGYGITQDEIITLVKYNVPVKKIIDKIKEDRTIFHLSIQDILRLKRKGVPASLLKFMQSTPTLFGKGHKARKSRATKKAQPHVKTAEELRKEAEAAKREQQRRAMELRRRMEAQRRMMRRNITRRGLEMAESGDWVAAIRTFKVFLKSGNYQKGTPEYYSASYGMAVAFARGGLAQSAARMFLDVLLMGPDKPFFKDAFLELRKLRKEIDYSPAALGREIASFDVSGFSQDFQDTFHYVLGEYFSAYGNYQRALKFFDVVSDKSSDKPKALYLTGLIQVQNKMYRSAVASFEKAITLSEQLKSAKEVIDLAYLALARIAYENGNYDAAIYYYKKVPQTSLALSQAFYELAWTYLLKLDYSRVLGIFHALHSPFFKRSFYPDLWILEARVYTDLCHYKRANAALREFDNTVSVLLPPIKNFVNSQRTPVDFFNNFVKAANAPAKTSPLPEIIIYKVISDIGFYNVYKTLKEIEREQILLKQNAAQLGDVGQRLQKKLAQLYRDKQIQGGITIQRLLRKIDNSISDAMVHETEIQVDLNAANMEKLQMETAELAGEEVAQVKKKGKKKKEAIIGDDQEIWNWDGDYWWDELPYYRGFLKDNCTEYAR
jgi:tetratricopeptide (TPR) repeat protein